MAYTGNRGKSLERLIEMTNKQYAAKGYAHIQKVATPWNVVRRGKQIISAFPMEKSTVDFIGISNGVFIAFDAKETAVATRFDLDNVHKHQIEYLAGVHHHKGIAFLLIEFTSFKEIYILPYPALQGFWERALTGGRKSITYEEMKQFEQVKQGRGIAFDYLGGIMNGL